jgi:hypothetical protein
MGEVFAVIDWVANYKAISNSTGNVGGGLSSWSLVLTPRWAVNPLLSREPRGFPGLDQTLCVRCGPDVQRMIAIRG